MTVLAVAGWLMLAAPSVSPQATPMQAPPKPVARVAPDPAAVALATQLIALADIDGTLDRLYVQLAPIFAQGVIGAMSNDESARDALRAIQAKANGHDRLIAILSQEFLRSMKRQYPAMKAKMAAEYADLFTRSELEAIITFYRSEAGAKALRLMPEIQQRMAQQGNELGRTAGAEAGLRAFERAAREILEVNEKPNA